MHGFCPFLTEFSVMRYGRPFARISRLSRWRPPVRTVIVLTLPSFLRIRERIVTRLGCFGAHAICFAVLFTKAFISCSFGFSLITCKCRASMPCRAAAAELGVPGTCNVEFGLSIPISLGDYSSFLSSFARLLSLTRQSTTEPHSWQLSKSHSSSRSKVSSALPSTDHLSLSRPRFFSHSRIPLAISPISISSFSFLRIPTSS